MDSLQDEREEWRKKGTRYAETMDVLNTFRDCIRILYDEAGIAIPSKFYSEKEAKRLKYALSKKPYSDKE